MLDQKNITIPQGEQRAGLMQGVFADLLKDDASAWDFVGNYYPNYYSCDTIGYCDDLEKLLENEYEDGDAAHSILMSDYEGDIENPKIQADYDSAHADVYKRAIEGFIAAIQESQTAKK